MTPKTDDQLRAVQERRQAQIGLGANEATEPPPPKFITVPCGVCGNPLKVPPMPETFRVKVEMPRLTCPECIEVERARREQERLDLAEEQRQATLKAVRSDPAAALAGCGVPGPWRNAALSECPDLPANLVLMGREWSERPRGILFLYGSPGSAKTWLAVAILRQVLEMGILLPEHCRYISERDYLEILKATFDKDSPDVPRRLLPPRHPARVPLLLYDDLAATYLTPWGRGAVCGLVEGRHSDQLPTVITSNIGPNALGQALDPRVVSRIAEWRRMLEFPERDLRVEGTVQSGDRPDEPQTL